LRLPDFNNLFVPKIIKEGATTVLKRGSLGFPLLSKNILINKIYLLRNGHEAFKLTRGMDSSFSLIFLYFT